MSGSIAELAINRQDRTNVVSGEVDRVAATMAHTEATMSELHLLTELDSADIRPPTFLDESLTMRSHSAM